MSWNVELTRAFTRDFDGLPAAAQRAVDARLDQLAADPFKTDLRKLQGTANQWRVRVGDYRIITVLDQATQRLTLLRVRHRRDVYR